MALTYIKNRQLVNHRPLEASGGICGTGMGLFFHENASVAFVVRSMVFQYMYTEFGLQDILCPYILPLPRIRLVSKADEVLCRPQSSSLQL